MCSDIGISKSLMTDLKSGRKKSVNAETAQKLASYFNVSVGYLLGEEDEKSPAPMSESGVDTEFMELFRRLGPDEQRMLVAQMRGLLDNQ